MSLALSVTAIYMTGYMIGYSNGKDYTSTESREEEAIRAEYENIMNRVGCDQTLRDMKLCYSFGYFDAIQGNEAKYPVLPSLSKGVNLAYTKHGEGVRLSFRTLCKYMGEIDEEFYEERFTTQERRCQNYSDEEKKIP